MPPVVTGFPRTPAAGPERIAVILGDRLESAMDHIAALGLVTVVSEEEG